MTNKSSILLLLFCFYGISVLSQNIEFIENKGQWDNQVKYMGRVSAGAFFVHQNGFTVLQHNPREWANMTETIHSHGQSSSNTSAKSGAGLMVHSHAYRVNFLGGAETPQIEADKPLYTYNNYFLGNDPSKWASHCRIYQGITVKDVYPNIDVRYYSGGGAVKYDLIVRPGGDPSSIAMKYDGADGLEIKDKELVIKTSVGNLKELNPYTYQYKTEGRTTISAKYSVKNNIVRFTVKDYDPKTTLVIDPDLVFCSFTGSPEENWGFTATYGPDGSMFGGGIVFGQGFPVSTGAYQTNYGGGVGGGFGGGFDIGLMKLSPDGVNRDYATYLGGNGNEMPQSLIVDEQGELIVAGRSNSPNYPVKVPAFFGTGGGGGFDITVTKFSAAGDAIIGSLKVGGNQDDGANISAYGGNGANSLLRNYGDEARSEVNLDNAGNIYLSSCTQSSNFYTVNAVQSTFGGGNQDGVVLKIDPTVSTLLFSTYLGGSADDAAYVISPDPINGNIYVAGGTSSPNMPGQRTGTIGSSSFGDIDGFVTIFTPTGSAIIKTSYVGTSGVDEVYGIKFDEKGFPYIMGQTTGAWPVINAPWSQNKGKQFIAKMQPDLSSYIYSTVFGKGEAVPDISPVAFLVDRCENVYISGWAGTVGGAFPSAGAIGLTVTPDALKADADPGTSGLGEDFYFFVLKRDATAQLYGSFFGQSGGRIGDHVDGGTSRFDKDGVIYQAICASCFNNLPFPTTPGVWAPTKPVVGTCNLAMVKIAFNLAGIKGKVRPSINGVPRDSTGCVPLTIDFTDTIQQAPNYEWNFGDGTPSVATTAPTITHTYNNVGYYKVMMIAIDPTKCFPRDTSYTNVKVGNNKANIDFNPVKLSPPCDTFRYRFDNTSFALTGPAFTAKTFTWDFGDGSAKITTGPAPVFHTYANAGTYNVKLILSDTAFCNSPDTLKRQLRVAANVKAIFTTPATGCAPYDAVFSNESVGGSKFIWDFGDGSPIFTTTASSVTHPYDVAGTYTIKMTAIDSNTCNIIDSTSFTIKVAAKPVAGFSASPQPPQVNTPISFTNLSSPDAIRFKWVFGDGDSLLTTSRSLLKHEFNLSTTYTTCLTAYNSSGCADQLCRQVSNLIEPAVDVPNAFTPQSGDANNKIFVRGFGITKLAFAIYARWGEKVFETADKHIGWDGKYKGQLLPMDVYAYTLTVEFADGKKFQKTGDITLIR